MIGKRTRFRVSLVSVVALLMVMAGGGVLAATYLTVIPATVQIVSNVQNVAVYSDAGLTSEVSELSVGSLEPNQAWMGRVFVANVGTSDVNIEMATQGNTSFGIVTYSPTSFTLVPSGFMQVDISVYALPTAVEGAYNFSVILTSP